MTLWHLRFLASEKDSMRVTSLWQSQLLEALRAEQNTGPPNIGKDYAESKL